MQASIESFLNGVLDNRRNFYIPVYQRNYSWQEEQCKVLFDDILRVYNGEYDEHFIGSIVWQPDLGNSNLLGLIDGQQRLTTMFLLTKAIMNSSLDERFSDKLSRILIDDYKNENRLTPIKSDNVVYEKVLKDEFDEIVNKSSRIYLNYLYFIDRLKTQEIDLESFFNTFNKLKVIKMELDYKDNPQVIFESINSTGMSLSIADLIRNFLLMNEDSKTQEYLFEKYWYKFEQRLGLENLILYFEHFLNVNIQNKVINRSNMYNFFKSYYMLNKFETEDLLIQFDIEIKIYEYLVTDKEYKLKDSKLSYRLNECKSDIIVLKNKVANMFLLPIIMSYEKGKLSEEDLVYAFEMTLSYIFRRSVIGIGTNSMQKVFRHLYSQTVINIDKYGFIKSLDYALVISKRNTGGRFPTNEEFYEAMSQRNLYGKFRYLEYLLLKLENYNNKTKVQSDNLTIEHIMPQTLTSYWKGIIGDNYKQIHEENVNDLGNLTLTSYNSNMSNFDFTRKKEILTEESHIKLNEYLKGKETWTIEEIETRGKYLASIGLDIWKYPNIDEGMQRDIDEDKYNKVTLDELIDNYESLKLKEFTISEEYTKKVKSYRELLDEVITYVCHIDEQKFMNIFVDSKEYTRISHREDYYIFSKNERNVVEGGRKNKETEIYFDVCRSGYNLIKIISKILEEYNISLEEVELKYYR